jgi:hypothetical protein
MPTTQWSRRPRCRRSQDRPVRQQCPYRVPQLDRRRSKSGSFIPTSPSCAPRLPRRRSSLLPARSTRPKRRGCSRCSWRGPATPFARSRRNARSPASGRGTIRAPASTCRRWGRWSSTSPTGASRCRSNKPSDQWIDVIFSRAARRRSWFPLLRSHSRSNVPICRCCREEQSMKLNERIKS